MSEQSNPGPVEYEFTPEQNAVFTSLSRWMVVVSVLVFLMGIYGFVMFLRNGGILGLVEAIIGVVLAVTFYLPVDNFRRIVNTKGRDISELMQAFNELSKGWLVVNLVTAAYVLLGVIYLVRALG